MNRITKYIVVLVLSLFSLNLYASEINITKRASVRMISQETKDKIEAKSIIRIVNAVFKEATKHKLDPFLILGMIKGESTFNPKAKNKSGAKGLMQVIPRYHRDKIRGRDIMQIETNVEVGVQVYVDCLNNNNGNMKKASRCYSGGAKNYTSKLKDGWSAAKKADIAYRFEHSLPLSVISDFDKPYEFSISVNTEDILLQLLAYNNAIEIDDNAY